MKKLGQIREQYDLITEKEEAETRKLATLVRAGLFDSKKLPMLKRALSKDAKDMTPAERKILIELLDSLMAEVLQSPQVYTKVKQSVAMKEEKDFEYEMARSELKALIADAQKILSNLKGEGNLEAWVQSKITKAADYINAAADNLEHSDEVVSEAKKEQQQDYLAKYDPRYSKMPTDREIPQVILLKRKAIRTYPDNQKVALYYSQALDKYVTIPFGTFGDGPLNEQVAPKPKKPDVRNDPKHQAMLSRIAAGQALRNKTTAQKEKVDSLTTPVKPAPEAPANQTKQPKKTDDTKSTREKEAEQKKKDFYSKKLTSKMDIGRAKVMLKRDPDIDFATRVGAVAGLAARRSWDNSATKKVFDKARSNYNTAKGAARKIDTAFEETSTKFKFYTKREQQKLDEYSKAELAWDAATMIPGVGNVLSGAEAAYKLAKGDIAGAAAAGAGAIPGVGQAGKAVKIGSKLAKAAGKEAGEKAAKEVGEKLLKKPTAPEVKPPAPTPARPQQPSKAPDKTPETKPAEVPSAKPEPKVEPKTEPKVEPKAEPKAQAKAEPKAEPVAAPKTGSRTGRTLRRIGRGAADAAGAAAAGLAALAAGGAGAVKKPTDPGRPFSMQVRTGRPVGNVRTGVDARDTAILRKTMQTESVLSQLYSFGKEDEKTIQIGNESVLINNNIAKKVIGVYESVNKHNKEKIEGMLNESVDSFKKILSFAARQ